MALNKPDMVLLDVDGTLVDTVPDLAYSIDSMCQILGMPERGEDKVRSWVGNGIERLVKRALSNDMEGEPDQNLYNKAFPVFLDIYSRNTCKHSKFYDGVQEGLNYLKKKNYKIGCVTNKRAKFTKKLLRSLNIYDDFGIVISGDTLPKKKPDPLPLLHAAEFFRVAPEKALMIGDSRNDVMAARNAGFQVVCVSYGYNQGEDIHLALPDRVVDSLSELPSLLET